MRLVRCLLATLAILAFAAPGLAVNGDIEKVNAGPAHPMVDALVLRPLGLLMLGVSGLLWVPTAAITAVTRPSELGMTTDHMLKRPAQFVFGDPLGTH